MKLGYSILLGEYVDAVFVSYEDCKHFQIVCPSCKEPIFKVTRDAEADPLHYLSHYKKDDAYEAECELRVSRISEEEIKQTNSCSRNQRILYFLSVFREAVLSHEYPSDLTTQVATKRYFRKLSKSKALTKFCELIFDLQRDPNLVHEEGRLNSYFDDYLKDIKEINGEFFRTAYSLEVQKRIGEDVWQHLLSAKAKENFFFLFDHAYIVLLTRFESARAKRGLFTFEIDLYKAMRRIPDANKDEGLAILSSMQQYPVTPPHAMENSNLLSKLCSELTHEMLGTLLRLPYFDLLRRRPSG